MFLDSSCFSQVVKLFPLFNQVGYHHLVSCVYPLRNMFLFSGCLIFSGCQEGLPACRRGYDSIGEALDPEAHALVPPGLHDGRVLAHRLVCLQLPSKLWQSTMRVMDGCRQKGTRVMDAWHIPSLASWAYIEARSDFWWVDDKAG